MAQNVIEGWMTEAELRWLGQIAGRMSSCVEVGCWKGRTTSVLLDNCKGPVYAVDHWQGSKDEREGPHREATERDIFEDFRANVGDSENLRVCRGESAAVAATVEPADFVFIDAGHTYDEVKADIEAWKPKTRRILAGHDYHMAEVRQAVDEAFGSFVRQGPGAIWYVSLPITRIMIGTPAYGGMVTAGYTASLLDTFVNVGSEHLRLELHGNESLVPRARVSIAGRFLSSDCTHLLFIDADIRWDWRDIVRLVKTGKDVVGGIYRKKQPEVRYPANFVPGTTDNLPFDEASGCFEMLDLPTGFMMISRAAMDRMVAAYPETRCMIGEGGWDSECNQNTYLLFDMPIDEHGMLLSEDFAFCRRWQRIGGKVWMLPDIELGHTGPHEFAGKISDIITRQDDAQPIAA